MELRKVLDYLEDRLEASEVTEVGTILRELPEGRALLERIKGLANLRSFPKSTIDPNLIAAYLDRTLSDEAIRNLEKETQQNDELLAEIISAHSCLPEIPWEGSGLDWGRRAGLNIPRLLRAAGQRQPIRPPRITRHQPDEGAEAVPGVRPERSTGILLTLAAAAGLFLMAWAGFMWESAHAPPAPPVPEEPPQPGVVPPPVARQIPALPPAPIMPAAVPPPAPAPNPDPPAELRAQLPAPIEADAITRRQLCPVPSRGGALLARASDEAPWRRLSAGDGVVSQELLMAVPGFAPELVFPGGATVVLWGNMPEASGNPMVQECEVRLHPAPVGITADISLVEGRIYLRNPAGVAESVFHVRFAGETWEIRLLGASSEAMIEKVPLPVSEEDWLSGSPVGAEIIAAAIRGRIRVQVDPASGLELEGAPSDRAFISWNSLKGTPAGPFAMRADEPLWNADGARSGRERQPYIAAFRELDQALSGGVNPLVALDNIVNKSTSTASARLTAITALGCLGDYHRLFGEMTDEQANEDRRQASAGSLRHWISESTDRARLLHDPNSDTGYLVARRDMTPQEAAYLVRLLLPMADAQARDKSTQKALVADLSHPRMAIRVVSQRALTDLAAGPFIHRSPVRYNSRGTEAAWRLSQSEWNRLIDQGKLPGKPAIP